MPIPWTLDWYIFGDTDMVLGNTGPDCGDASPSKSAGALSELQQKLADAASEVDVTALGGRRGAPLPPLLGIVKRFTDGIRGGRPTRRYAWPSEWPSKLALYRYSHTSSEDGKFNPGIFLTPTAMYVPWPPPDSLEESEEEQSPTGAKPDLTTLLDLNQQAVPSAAMPASALLWSFDKLYVHGNPATIDAFLEAKDDEARLQQLLDHANSELSMNWKPQPSYKLSFEREELRTESQANLDRDGKLHLIVGGSPIPTGVAGADMIERYPCGALD